MFDIVRHSRNADQNHSEIALHMTRMATVKMVRRVVEAWGCRHFPSIHTALGSSPAVKKRKEKKIRHVDEIVEKSGPSSTAAGNVQWCSCSGENTLAVLPIIK